MDTQGPTVAAVETGFHVLEYLQEHDGGGVTEIAVAIDRSPSTVYNHLSTLKGLGYVIQAGDRYELATRLSKFGETARRSRHGYQLAAQKVEKLAAETEERAQFVVEEHGYAVYVHRATGEKGVWTDPGIGKSVALHATAAGKAILAFLPEEHVDDIVEAVGLPAVTAHTITDPDVLFDELDVVRERGYAFNEDENVDGLRAVGVPIKSQDSVLGALTVSGPSHRLRGESFRTDLPNKLLGIANELELNIRYSGPPPRR